MFPKWNDTYQKWSYERVLAFIIFFTSLLLAFASSPSFADEDDGDILNKLNTLEVDFQQFSDEFYGAKDNFPAKSSTIFSNYDELLKQIKAFKSEKEFLQAIYLISSNVKLIEENLDNSGIFFIFETLLEHNSIDLANQLYVTINNEGDDFHLAKVELILAKYYNRKLEWNRVLELLDTVSTDLSEEDYAYANLLKGTALQNLKMHREAEQIYQKIPPSSIYYRHAQLNYAITQIRQEWLTNAQIAINKLTEKTAVTDDELTNRLHLVLGYALLRKNYFRNARDAFRNISQNSIYANRALFGIALSAINQEDMESALNTLSILKNKKGFDISIDESYLLSTYVYEKLDQQADVIATTTEAMNYYQERITNLQKAVKNWIDFSQLNFDFNKPAFKIQDYSIDYGKKYPTTFLTEYRDLLTISKLNRNPALDKKIGQLIANYDEAFQLIIKQLISKKINDLNSYLNQARYGLARLYDKSGREK